MQDVTCVMCGAELVELWRRCVASAGNCEELSTFQALLFISARRVARAALFTKRQIKYITSEGCGLKCQGHLQVANIINSDWIGEVFQLQYSCLTLIRCVCACVCVCVCVCVRRYSATDMWFSLYSKQLNTTYKVGQNRQRVSAIIRPFLRTLNNSHLTERYRLLSNVQQYRLTDCMEQSASGDANRFSASQETVRFLWNSKFYYRIHKCPTPVLIPSQLDPVHTSTSHFLKTHLNIIVMSAPCSYHVRNLLA